MDFIPGTHSATALESQANRHTIKCLIFTALPLTVSWVLTLFGVFMVDKGLMTLTCLVSDAILLVPWGSVSLPGPRRAGSNIWSCSVRRPP